MSTSTTVRPGQSAPHRPSGSSAVGPPPRRHRRWLQLLIAVLALAVLVAGGWLVAFSSVLATEQVAVSGTDVLSADEVRAAAQVPLGRPLARQDTDAIAARVAALGPVSSVRVTRRWPRTLLLTVVERTPVLAVARPSGFELVDAVGSAYLSVSSLPTGVVETTADPADPALLSTVGVVASALPPALARKVRTIGATSADGISLTLRDGDRVVWGSSDESVLKGQVLAALLAQPARTYDVSAPHNPTIH